MDFKRIILLSGHYGSGKTNIAVNLAFMLKKTHERVTIADVDIVNPYFRTSDSRRELEENGIRLICSEFAGSNVDLPALPASIYAVTADPSQAAVIDVGGDDRGALALGRLRDQILEENNYEMLFVINRFRPLTQDADKEAEFNHGKILRKKQTRIPEAYTLFRGHNSAGACLVNDRDNLSNYNNLCGCIP